MTLLLRLLKSVSSCPGTELRGLRGGNRGFLTFSRAALATPTRSSLLAAAQSADSGSEGASSAAASSSPKAELPPSTGVHARWRSHWGAFLASLYEGGHFAADPGVQSSQLDVDKGAVKRAVLSFARQRSDLRYSLPQEELRALVKAGFPRPDRKSINAYKRLEASILRGADLPPGDGGAADFQDVMRMLYALAVVDAVTAELESPGLAAAACNLMPDIIKAAQESSLENAGSKRGLPRRVTYARPRQGAAEGGPRRRRSPPSPAAAGGPGRGGGSPRQQQRSASGGPEAAAAAAQQQQGGLPLRGASG